MYLLDLGCVALYTTHDNVVFDIGCDSLCRMYDNVCVRPGADQYELQASVESRHFKEVSLDYCL